MRTNLIGGGADMTPLYERYRPQTLDAVIGQTEVDLEVAYTLQAKAAPTDKLTRLESRLLRAKRYCVRDTPPATPGAWEPIDWGNLDGQDPLRLRVVQAELKRRNHDGSTTNYHAEWREHYETGETAQEALRKLAESAGLPAMRAPRS